MSNPYAPPIAAVSDVVDPRAGTAAERGTRLAAAILDGIIFAAMVYVPFLAAIAVGGATAAGADRSASANTAMLIGFAIGGIGFIAWSWISIVTFNRSGQSIAKKMMHIKVVRSDGSPVSLSRLILLRNVVNSLLAIIPFYGFVDGLMIFGESRQCLHDKLADTIVVKA